MSKSYEDILKEVLNNAPPGIDTRQGSIYYDSVAGICLTIARLYTDIETQGRLVTIVRAVGEELTVKAAEYGIARHPAAPAKYHFSYEGESRPSANDFTMTAPISSSCTATTATITCKPKQTGLHHLSAVERLPSL